MFGRALTAGTVGVDPAAIARGARGLVGILWVVAVVVFGVRAVGQRGTLTNAEGVLTVVPTSEAYLGLVASEFVYLLLWTLLPAVGAGIGLALGTGVVWPVVGAPLALGLAGASAVAAAYAVGLGIRHVLTSFPFVARHKTALIAVAFVGYMGLVVSGSLNRAVAALFEPVAASPVGWFADLALRTVPSVATETSNAALAAVTATAFTAVAVAAGAGIASRHWFADPALAGEDESGGDAGRRGVLGRLTAIVPAGSAGASTGGATPGTARGPGTGGAATATADDPLARRLESVLARPTAALVTLAWRRAARSPLKLMYAAYPLFFGTAAFVDIVQSGAIPAYLPYGLLVFVAWAGGVVFTLNPLGDQGSVLATTLLSEVTGRRFVAAHVFAGLVVVVPVGTALVGVTAVLSPLPFRRAATLTALAPVSAVVAAGLSVGVGMAFPRFETTNVTRSMEAVVPSPMAFLLFSAHLVATTVAALFVGIEGARSVGAGVASFALSYAVRTEVTVAPGTVFAASAVALVVLLVLPALSYRYAVRSFDRYEVV